MSADSHIACTLSASADDAAERQERRLEQLTRRLPRRMQPSVRRLRRPEARWMRIPAGLLLIAGSGLSVLPVFGLWMLPLGLFLLAEDVPPLRRARARLLDRIAARRPHWFAENDDTSRTPGTPAPGEQRSPNNGDKA